MCEGCDEGRARTALNPNQILEGTIAKGVFEIYVSNLPKREHLDEKETHRNIRAKRQHVEAFVADFIVEHRNL